MAEQVLFSSKICCCICQSQQLTSGAAGSKFLVSHHCKAELTQLQMV